VSSIKKKEDNHYRVNQNKHTSFYYGLKP